MKSNRGGPRASRQTQFPSHHFSSHHADSHLGLSINHFPLRGWITSLRMSVPVGRRDVLHSQMTQGRWDVGAPRTGCLLAAHGQLCQVLQWTLSGAWGTSSLPTSTCRQEPSQAPESGSEMETWANPAAAALGTWNLKHSAVYTGSRGCHHAIA